MSARQLRDLRDDMASYVSATEPMLARWVAELDRAIRAAESAERRSTFLPSRPLFTLGASFFISSWLVLMCSTASSQPFNSSAPCTA